MKEFWQVLVKYVKPYKGYLGGSIILNILSAILNIFSFSLIIPILQILFKMNDTVYSFIPWDTAGMGIKEIFINNAYYGITLLIQDKGAPMTLFLLCAWLCIMTLLKTACYFGSSAIMIPIRTSVVRDMRRELYHKILTLPLGFFSQERKGDIIARMSGDINEVENSIMSTLDMLLKNPILIIFYIGTLIVTSWQLTLFTIVVAPALIWLMSALGRTLKKRSLQAQALWSDTMSQLEETLGGLRVIKAFVAEDKMQSRFDHVTEAVKKKTGRVSTRQALAHPMSEFLGTVLIAIVLGFGGVIILSEKAWFDAPTFIFYMVILYSVINPLKDFAKAGYNIPKGMASVERVNKILETESNLKEIPDAKEVEGFNDEITFDHVSFSYDTDRKILDDINLSVKKGSTVAIVGESGAGKSTLVDLIPRFYDVTGGSVTVDGIDVRQMPQAQLHDLLGYVPQKGVLFSGTIDSNLKFGGEDITDAQVQKAAAIAQATDFIEAKPEGYQSPIAQGGSNVSGGQKQRLSIARAIAKDPKIYLFDDSFSALDYKTDVTLRRALKEETDNATVIIVAQRISTVLHANQILVLDDGRLVGKGTHAQLMANCPEYQEIARSQLSQKELNLQDLNTGKEDE